MIILMGQGAIDSIKNLEFKISCHEHYRYVLNGSGPTGYRVRGGADERAGRRGEGGGQLCHRLQVQGPLHLTLCPHTQVLHLTLCPHTQVLLLTHCPHTQLLQLTLTSPFARTLR